MVVDWPQLWISYRTSTHYIASNFQFHASKLSLQCRNAQQKTKTFFKNQLMTFQANQLKLHAE